MQSVKRDKVTISTVQQPCSTTGQFTPVSGKQTMRPHQLDELMTAESCTRDHSRKPASCFRPYLLIRTKVPNLDRHERNSEWVGSNQALASETAMQRTRKSGVL